VTSPILALRAAILAACAGDATLLALMGGSLRLHGEPPRGAEGVYAMFGDAEAQDWSTGDDRGHRHEATILVYGRPGSARAALEVASRLATLIDDAPLALDDHRLVLLRVAAIEAGRDDEAKLARVTLRLSALTETL
jgi:hypothetical protein